MSGGGKSNALLMAMSWFSRFNKDIEPIEEGYTPCAVYLSLENTKGETQSRMFSTFVPFNLREGRRYDELSQEEVDEYLEDAGAHQPTLIYDTLDHRSANTGSVEAYVDRLWDDKFDVRLLVVDYANILPPMVRTGDSRIDHGQVVRELKDIALEKRLPIISAVQLNAIGAATLEKEDTNPDALKQVYSNALAESRLMLNNTDALIYIHSTEIKDVDKGDAALLGVNIIKMRSEDQSQGVKFFSFPFLERNSLILEEDVNERESRHRLTDPLALAKKAVTVTRVKPVMTSSSSGPREI